MGGTARRGLGGPQPAQAHPRCTKCNSQCVPVTLLLYFGPLLRGFNVPIEGLDQHCRTKKAATDCYCHLASVDKGRRARFVDALHSLFHYVSI